MNVDVIDISCGGLAAASPTASTVLGAAVALTSGETRVFGRVCCDAETDARNRRGDPAVLAEPWAHIDAERVELGGLSLPFTEVAGATLRRAANALAEHGEAKPRPIRLVVPTHWGHLRRTTAEAVATEQGLTASLVRAALVIADALESSSARWTLVAEFAARGASLTLVERSDGRVRLVDQRFVLAVDPDDDVPGGGEGDRVMAAIAGFRERHRGTRTGSFEILACGRAAEGLADRCDVQRLPCFPVPAGAAAERAAAL